MATPPYNQLSVNGFMFTIPMLRDMDYFSQQVTIPGIDLPSVLINTPLSPINIPGDVVEFQPFSITFAVNEDLSNYSSIVEWIKGIGFPEDHNQFKDYLLSREEMGLVSDPNTIESMTSDGTLMVISSNNLVTKRVVFKNMFPTNLGDIEFRTTDSEQSYAYATATFQYTTYSIENP